MNYFKICSLLLALLLAAGCSSSKQKKPASGKDLLLEVLTDFSIAINANSFEKALNYLETSEKTKLLGGSPSITPEIKLQLKALNLQKLIKNPRIKLLEGKLIGIVAALPSLAHIELKDSSATATEEPTGPESRPEPESQLEEKAEPDAGEEAGPKAEEEAEPEPE